MLKWERKCSTSAINNDLVIGSEFEIIFSLPSSLARVVFYATLRFLCMFTLQSSTSGCSTLCMLQSNAGMRRKTTSTRRYNSHRTFAISPIMCRTVHVNNWKIYDDFITKQRATENWVKIDGSERINKIWLAFAILYKRRFMLFVNKTQIEEETESIQRKTEEEAWILSFVTQLDERNRNGKGKRREMRENIFSKIVNCMIILLSWKKRFAHPSARSFVLDWLSLCSACARWAR